MKIYTRTGDKGETSLGDGTRVKKSDFRIELLGEIDELNAVLGLAGGLEEIQKDLYLISGIISGAKNLTIEQSNNFNNHVLDFEKEIDALDKKLPELHNFISVGGTQRAGFLHLGRSVCRRAERRAVELDEKEELGGKEGIIVYLNRLSDLLFMLARFENQTKKVKEKILKR